MTLENMKNGKPMDVYGTMGEGGMFLQITLNNIFVSLLFFVLGITIGIGTLVKLVQTGVMVGAFLCFFYQQDYLGDAMLSIWMHGTIEISVAVIAGAAGLVLGKSIAFPGTYSRLESIKRGAKDGLKIVIGLVPCFIIAGFIESFLTRHYNAQPILSAAIIMLSLAFVLTYFVVYPIYLRRKLMIGETIEAESKSGSESIAYGLIWAVGGIFASLASYRGGTGGVLFILFYGPVGYGIYLIIRGMKQNRKIKQKAA
jgi:uncharacterized membrane protein SpoIIM required for sporulation